MNMNDTISELRSIFQKLVDFSVARIVYTLSLP